MKVVEISNRIDIPEPGKPNAGGVDEALSAAPHGVDMIRFGWSGKLVNPDTKYDDKNPPVHKTKKGGVTYITVDLPEAVFIGFYNGTANKYWWPLLHGRNDLSTFSESDARQAQRVNEIFASALEIHVVKAGLIDKNTPIRVHDYHFLDLGQELRKNGIENPLSFFLHVPVPERSDLLNQKTEQASAYAFQQLRKLYAYDAVGLQSPTDMENLTGVLNEGHVTKAPPFYQTISTPNPVNGGEFRMGVFPVMGHTEEYRNIAESFVDGRGKLNRDFWRAVERIDQASGANGDLAKKLEPIFSSDAHRALVSHGRLDYTKDLPSHLKAMDLALSGDNKESASTVHLLQIAAYGRKGVQAYVDEHDKLVGAHHSLTEKFGHVATLHTQPVDRSLILGMLRVSRAGILSSPKEGAGLVAYEYIAAQDPHRQGGPGVLILSKQAGSASIIPANGALMIDPGKPDQLAQAIVDSGHLSRERRIDMFYASMNEIAKYTNGKWYEKLVEASIEARDANKRNATQFGFGRANVFDPT